jgi:2,4-dienoyl-CoA reductase-like NADH-dependent reductase (Old Yellow Enzyme family)/thioredoxin reductase
MLMSEKKRFDHLFSPITINGMELKNRAVMPAMGTAYAGMDNTPSERLIQYLARRARGGTGLIIVEVTAVTPRGKGFPNELGIWSDAFIPALAKIPEAIHAEGGKVAIQLHHAGRETFPQAAGGLPEAPSPIPSVILGQPCEEMSLERIHEVIDAFASAASRAKEAGFDAVEIHGAHGYLLNQFLSPFSNQRQDTYGGSEENRSRFVLEIVEKTRKAVGKDFPIIVRFSAEELVKGGFDLEFTKRLAPRLVSAGADALHVSVGVYSTPGNLSIASMDTPPGFNLFRARAIREVAGAPVIAVGRISDPMLAEKALAEGDADLISFGRQHLTDPDFINKVRSGDLDDIRPCVACNQGCIDRLSFEMKSATCSFNPECGQEFRPLRKAEVKKKVWVVGAGPAGISAAMAASERGHEVTVFEREDSAGGQLRSASRPPHKEGFWGWVEWALRRLSRQGVQVRLGTRVTPELLKSGKPDTVILTSGAYPVTAPIPGIDGPHVLDARDVLTGKSKATGPAVILGAGYVGMETADFLADKGVETVILEMQPSPPVGKITAHGYWLHKRIREGGGRMYFGAAVTRIENNAVHFTKGGEDNTVPAASVITAMGARADTALEAALRDAGIPFITAGDAKGPRRILEAIHEGHRAGGEV